VTDELQLVRECSHDKMLHIFGPGATASDSRRLSANTHSHLGVDAPIRPQARWQLRLQALKCVLNQLSRKCSSELFTMYTHSCFRLLVPTMCCLKYVLLDVTPL